MVSAGVAPDICTFSKTISNGFAMAAVIGTQRCDV
jgi:4-aminobutyrate aminotransferase-like enzyme